MTLVLFIAGLLAFLLVVSFGLSSLEARRREQPLAFRCTRCNADFQQAPHLAFPEACPSCGARDWAKG